ncbi:MAG: glycoside hydrolase [Cyclobacteriaceae bacterium]|nr:glycoside hydrolase [Cyclobacteriaceae bacterium]
MNKLILFLAVIAVPAFSQTHEELKTGFLTPPEEAKPHTWWHWIGSNVTKEGITKDLEWMKRAGIGGFQAFDVSLGMGQVVEKKIVFMTPEWLDAIRHTAAEAERLGLEMTMVTSAGWSETGGPWVKPEEAIKKVVWSELSVAGGKKFSGQLPAPPFNNGPIRNLSRPGGFLSAANAKPDPTYFKDYKVIAFNAPNDEVRMMDLKPKVTSSAGAVEAAALLDDDLTSSIKLPLPKPESHVWIQFEFIQPFKAQSFSLATALTNSFGSKDVTTGYVQVSDDGVTFKTILSLPGPQHDIRAIPVRTYTFPEVSARYYRITFTGGSGLTTVGDFGSAGYFGPAPTTMNVTEAKFFSEARVNRWEDKAHFAPMFDLEALATLPVSESSSIHSVFDLTDKMKTDGTLTWDAPAGHWTILRIGYSLTGSKNSPAVPAGIGYEVDKLSKKHLEAYYKGYTNPIAQALGPLYGKSLQYWLTDSFEADAQNWTEDLPTEFLKRRGYDMTSYLPVLSGRIVKSAEISDRFLWDFRRTLADMLAENHYKALGDMARAQGIKLYGESAGISLPIIQDAMLNKKYLDIPMGEFGMTQGLGSADGSSWKSPKDLDDEHAYRGAGDRLHAHQSDIREAASAAHIYGKKFVATESWTGGAFESPASMKLIGDYWNTQGVNRFIFHTSTHQPLDTKPGNAMVGTHIHRNITWAEQALPFTTYLSRNSYLLQQGTFVADIAYYLGEGIPSSVPYWKKIKPEPPAGYDFDFLGTDILLEDATVVDGKIVLKSGMSYRLLVLPDGYEMTPPVMNKLKELIAQGATVVGPKPTRSPSLADYPNADKMVALTANELWGDADGQLIYHHAYEKGHVYWGIPLSSILAEMKVGKDVNYTKPHTTTYLSWIHRKTQDAHIYFISNLRNQKENVKIEFRITGKIPELWHADTGEMEAADYSIAHGITTVSYEFNPEESVFVIFSKQAVNLAYEKPKTVSKTAVSLDGSWNLAFPPNLGAPEKIALDKLISLSEHPEAGVKYFGGTVTYKKEFTLDKAWFKPGNKFILDLGIVKDIAEISVNGKVIGTLWKLPYQIDITSALKQGTNSLEIKVTNQWTNRIAGDEANPNNKVLAGAGLRFGGGNTKLIESGLMGPVTVKQISNQK